MRINPARREYSPEEQEVIISELNRIKKALEMSNVNCGEVDKENLQLDLASKDIKIKYLCDIINNKLYTQSLVTTQVTKLDDDNCGNAIIMKDNDSDFRVMALSIRYPEVFDSEAAGIVIEIYSYMSEDCDDKMIAYHLQTALNRYGSLLDFYCSGMSQDDFPYDAEFIKTTNRDTAVNDFTLNKETSVNYNSDAGVAPGMLGIQLDLTDEAAYSDKISHNKNGKIFDNTERAGKTRTDEKIPVVDIGKSTVADNRFDIKSFDAVKSLVGSKDSDDTGEQ